MSELDCSRNSGWVWGVFEAQTLPVCQDVTIGLGWWTGSPGQMKDRWSPDFILPLKKISEEEKGKVYIEKYQKSWVQEFGSYKNCYKSLLMVFYFGSLTPYQSISVCHLR